MMRVLLVIRFLNFHCTSTLYRISLGRPKFLPAFMTMYLKASRENKGNFTSMGGGGSSVLKGYFPRAFSGFE